MEQGSLSSRHRKSEALFTESSEATAELLLAAGVPILDANARFYLQYNPSLLNVDGASNATALYYLYIEYNDSLVDLTGFDGFVGNSNSYYAPITYLYIRYNPAYPECQIATAFPYSYQNYVRRYLSTAGNDTVATCP